MGATSITGSGQGTAISPANLNYNLDNIRKVYVNDNGNFLPCVELVGDKWVLRNQASLTSSGPIIISGSSVQCDADGNPRGLKAYDFQCCRTDPSQVASGDHSFIAGGCNNTASGTYSHAEGYSNTSRSDFSHTEGYFNQVNGAGGHGEGAINRVGNIPRPCTLAGTTVTIPGGNFTNEFINLTQVYFFNLTGGTSNTLFTAIRYNISGVTFNGSDTLFTISSAIGDRTGGMCVCGVFGQFSHCEGVLNVVNGQACHVEGQYNTLVGNFLATNYSHAEGSFNTVTNKTCHVEGKSNTASGYISHVEGQNNLVTGRASHGEGNSTIVTANYAHAEGNFTYAYGFASHSEGGAGVTAQGQYSHAEGTSGRAFAGADHAEGAGKSHGYASHAEGFNISVGRGSHAEGRCDASPGEYGTGAHATYSHSEGQYTRVGNPRWGFSVSGTTVTIYGFNLVAEFPNGSVGHFFALSGGVANTLFVADRTISGVAFGGGNTTFTISSPLSDRTGGMCVVPEFGRGGHSEGFRTIATGLQAHAEGHSTTASGDQAHVEGYQNTASGLYCHAEGGQNTASGWASHVEGYKNTASGRFSHAEGDFSVASGWAGHAEGLYCFASGDYSHAEGYGSIASGYISHAGGERSVASNACQWARASGQFTSSVMALGEAQFSFVVMRQATTNASATEMFIKPDISSRLVIPTNNTSAVTITIVARQQGGSKNASFKRYCIIKNDAGTTALVGSVQTLGTDIGSNAGSPPAGWAVSVTADDPNNSLKIEVTGEAATNIRWVAHVELVEVIYT